MATPLWTAPTTWATGNVPTAAQFNAQLRDNPLHVATPPMVQSSRSTTQSIPNVTWTDVLFTSETWDTDAFHDTAVNPGRHIVPAGLGGIYECVASVQFTASATGQTRRVAFAKNGGSQLREQSAPPQSASFQPALVTTGFFQLVAGDYITCQVFQDSGGALNTTAGDPFFDMRKVSN